MPELVIGVDGGNSKTDLVLATTTGRLLARVRGEGTRPHVDGMTVTARGVADLVHRARREAGVKPSALIAVGAYFLANVDVPAAERAAVREIAALGLAERTVVHNDSFAVLRAGAPEGWGVAVVSGAGINAVGVHPDGRVARFLALGDITGDWGGGQSVGREGLGAAIRAGDGRGPRTALRRSVPAYFGMRTPEQVALAVESGRIAFSDLYVLAPTVFRTAEEGDGPALAILHRLGDEVVTMVSALLRRLNLLRTMTPVVLGGGTLQKGPEILRERIYRGLDQFAPRTEPRVLDVAPVAGALKEALTVAGSDGEAQRRARRSLREDADGAA